MTRTAQGNDSQRWILAEHAVVYLVRQRSSGRFLDAHETPDRDFSVVTRPSQADDSQLWVLEPVASGAFTVRQLRTSRFLDAFDSEANQFRVVTRTAQNDSSQQGCSTPSGPEHSTGRRGTDDSTTARRMHRATEIDMTQPRRMWRTRIAGERQPELAVNHV